MFYDDEIIFLAVELKYCERCGSLYVRCSETEAKLCLPCIEAERMVENFFLSARGDLRVRGWVGSVGAVLAAARPWAGAMETDGGMA
jgi:hypothetical protein